jgi:hypothetical protein
MALDLGSGAGFDCFLAARRVGPGRRVIGIDNLPPGFGVPPLPISWCPASRHFGVQASKTIPVYYSNCILQYY